MDEHLYDAFFRLERSHWWFVARQQILLRLTRRFLPPGGKFLDVGCGTGDYLETASREFDGHGIDCSATAVRICRERGLTNVTATTLEDLTEQPQAQFNAVMFFDVIEHLDDDTGTLAAARRVLVPGGVVMVTVPAYQFLWSRHDDENQHRRRYTARQLRARLKTAGYRVEMLTYFNTLLFPLAVARRTAQRFFPQPDYDELAMPRGWRNACLRRVFGVEAPFVKRASAYGLFPFGLSIAAVGRFVGGPVK